MNTNDAARLARLETENTQLREAVRVLGADLRNGWTFHDSVVERGESLQWDTKTSAAVLANPIASAAVNPMYTPPANTGEGVEQ